MVYRDVSRADDPVGFWTAIIISGGLSVGLAMTLLFQVR